MCENGFLVLFGRAAHAPIRDVYFPISLLFLALH